jgi:DNA-binding NarL/FixJ family response regulator
VEDNAVTRKVIRQLVSKHREFEFVRAWPTGEEALAEVSKLRPDVMLIDLELPGISGEDCLRALSGVLPAAALLVLTSHEDPARVFASLSAGAHGYLLKGSPPAELVAGIKAAYAGGSPLSPAVAGLVIRAFKENTAAAQTSIPLPSLAPREQQILELLAMGKVPKEAAAELSLSYATVRDYLKHIYRKLHVRSRTEAVLRYLEAGQRPGAPKA